MDSPVLPLKEFPGNASGTTTLVSIQKIYHLPTEQCCRFAVLRTLTLSSTHSGAVRPDLMDRYHETTLRWTVRRPSLSDWPSRISPKSVIAVVSSTSCINAMRAVVHSKRQVSIRSWENWFCNRALTSLRHNSDYISV